MRELGVEGLTDDGQFMIVRDPSTDEQFRVPVVSEEPQPSTPPEPSMENHLTPREIQTRIRRGESPDDIAADTGMPVTSIEPFAGAVIAEREYMAQQAQRTSVRRRHVTGSGIRLGDLVEMGLREKNLPVDDAVWDAFRREDGRWTVLVTPTGSDATATFLYDAESRYVMPVDDAAHDLVGDVAVPDTSDMALAEAVREPVVEAELIVEPEPEPVMETEPEPQPEPEAPVEHSAELELDLGLSVDRALLPPVSSLKEARDRRAQTAMAQAVESEVEQIIADHDDLDDEVVQHDIAVPDAPAPSKKRHERRRVPSWDEIMFGDRH